MLPVLSTITRSAIGLMFDFLAYFCAMHYAANDEMAPEIPFADARTCLLPAGLARPGCQRRYLAISRI
jgi:hypothetical protein